MGHELRGDRAAPRRLQRDGEEGSEQGDPPLPQAPGIELSMHPDSEREREAIAAEAAEWFAANYEPLDAAKRTEFGEWLRRSPRHRQEYLELLRLSRRLQSASAEPPS